MNAVNQGTLDNHEKPGNNLYFLDFFLADVIVVFTMMSHITIKHR